MCVYRESIFLLFFLSTANMHTDVIFLNFQGKVKMHLQLTNLMIIMTLRNSTPMRKRFASLLKVEMHAQRQNEMLF